MNAQQPQPCLGVFRGGPRDGEQLTLPSASPTFRLPVDEAAAELALAAGRPAGEPFAGGELVYRRAGELEPLPGGARVFVYVFEGQS